MTQELIASMLGVRREGITEAAGKLQHAGFIRYRRGHIVVLERAGLETRVCECYAVVKKELNRLLSDISRGDPPSILGRSTPLDRFSAGPRGTLSPGNLSSITALRQPS